MPVLPFTDAFAKNVISTKITCAGPNNEFTSHMKTIVLISQDERSSIFMQNTILVSIELHEYNGLVIRYLYVL